jgi:putative Flp pilus-assembly TadE/G-like protein
MQRTRILSRVARNVSRPRRGATLVMVTLMLVGLLGVGAIAADIGRFYAVATELQTAADAAALAGALQLQKTPGPGAETYVDSAVMNFVTTTNHADGVQPLITTNDIRVGYYIPPSRPSKTPLDFDLNGRHANAVSVVVSALPKGFFAQLLGQTGVLPLSDTAVAWAANLSEQHVRPWALPYTGLYGAVTGNVGVPDPAPDLKAGDLVQYFQSHSQPDQRRFILLPPQGGPSSIADGEWTGFNFSGLPGQANFTSGISSPWPNNLDVETMVGHTDPASISLYANWTTNAIPLSAGGICFHRATDAGCYPDPVSSVPGKMIQAAWSDSPVGTTVKFRFVGDFLLTCYYVLPTDVCGATKQNAPQSGFPEGTIVGMLTAIKSRAFEAGDVLNDTPSNVQRIVLVR